MRKFRITGGRYGGEITIGHASKDFVEYWAPKVDEDGDTELVEYILNADWNDEVDPLLPTILADGNTPWYEVDDIEHTSSCYADGGFYAVEIDDNGDEIDDEIELTFSSSLYSREAYHETQRPVPTKFLTQEEIDDYVPVLVFHSGEKGSFGQWIVETEEDFDPYKFTYSILETNLGEFVERAWYDGVEIYCDYDWCDSTGKGYYASVGYMNPKWHDLSDIFTDEYLEENDFWSSFQDSVEWQKEQPEKNNE